ncbi:DNA internalization-related competence protein ComEC/Rec2 [Xylophilus sp. Leaf220]|uniref:DNA internalization-related competence protein ComEC/Rec2 n=1 Tax=Xylophilus sp. Leaf220 TaxID=1735686 RepID=UPI001EFF72E2|nr:DNA internalization-related competence protein ComEC/Rec2 [Xylophilus sp. Leaf220]
MPRPAAAERPDMAWALVGAIGGTGLQLLQPVLSPVSVYAAVAVAGLAVLLLRATRRARLSFGRLRASGAVLLLAALAAGWGATGLRAAWFAADALDPALEGRDLAMTGTVVAMPQRAEAGLRLRFAPDTAVLEGAPVRVPPLVDLGWHGAGAFGGADPLAAQASLPDVRAGDRWQWTVRLKAPHGTRNPHGFDYELWAWEQGVQATGTVRVAASAPRPRLLGPTWRYPVERARQAVRDAIYARLALPGGAAPDTADARRRAAGVVAALVTGDQRAIDRADWDVFRATGVAHLVSISGLHVTMFAWLAAAVIGRLWRRSGRLCRAVPAQHAALLGGVALAAGYALFSGGGLPAQRTVCMLAVVALLRLSGRRWPWPQVWLAACAAVVALDPWALLQAGFWLSFVAVGVLFATDSIAGGRRVTPAAGTFHSNVGRWAGRLLREQAVVTLALTPLTLLLFGQASAVGLVANLVAIPWMTLLVTPLAMGGVVLPVLWDAAAWAVQAMGGVLAVMAAWPWATVARPAAPAWAAAAAVLGGALLCMRLPVPLRLLGLAPLLPALFWQPPRPAPGQFELLAADIGQGNAVLVRTAGHSLLYDTGPRYSADSDAGHRVLVPLLQALGERLDTVVVSHRDTDHAGGAAAVLARQPQATLRSSVEAGHPLQALRPIDSCTAGQHWDWDGVRFEFLHPAAADYTAAAKSNALSCVLRISTGSATALLVGDIEAAQEDALRSAGAPLAADVLLVPHHGSRTSSTAAFVDAVAPRWAIVQAGYRNRFGHPAPEVAARYAARGATLVASPDCGAARWSSAAPGRMACERRVAPHYWQHLPQPGSLP